LDAVELKPISHKRGDFLFNFEQRLYLIDEQYVEAGDLLISKLLSDRQRWLSKGGQSTLSDRSFEAAMKFIHAKHNAPELTRKELLDVARTAYAAIGEEIERLETGLMFDDEVHPGLRQQGAPS
jgi:hypothetical protein